MKKFLLLATFAVCFTVHSVHYGLADEGSRVAVVDIEKILKESKLGKEAQAKVEKEANTRRKTVDQIRGEVESAKADLEKQQGILSEEAFARKREELKERETIAVRKVEDEREAMEKVRREALRTVMERVNDVIRTLGNERKYSFIMDRDEAYVVYAAPSIDITDEIITALKR